MSATTLTGSLAGARTGPEPRIDCFPARDHKPTSGPEECCRDEGPQPAHVVHERVGLAA